MLYMSSGVKSNKLSLNFLIIIKIILKKIIIIIIIFQGKIHIFIYVYFFYFLYILQSKLTKKSLKSLIYFLFYGLFVPGHWLEHMPHNLLLKNGIFLFNEAFTSSKGQMHYHIFSFIPLQMSKCILGTLKHS